MATKHNLKNITSKESDRIQAGEVAPRPNFNTYRPVFSFWHMRYRGDGCLSQCEIPARAAVALKLLKISQLTWRDIINAPREGNGFEMMSQESLKVSVPSTISPDVKMMIFRFSGAGRFAGFRENDVYHIALISEDHDLY